MTDFRLVQATYYARRFDETVRAGRIVIELTPDSPYNPERKLMSVGISSVSRNAAILLDSEMACCFKGLAYFQHMRHNPLSGTGAWQSGNFATVQNRQLS